ncbi:MAG TPA: hypothetical protein VHS31_19470 [Tepidisphaeraceae bacterium]|nr:hypothetical protein [Tepidisphaeraceae bacterium]
MLELLENRLLMSGSNAIDQLSFGNLASESSHNFEPGFAAGTIPITGVGTVGASVGQTYRDPTGSQIMTFMMAVDPNRQNYLTIRLWGNDIPTTNMDLAGELQFGGADPTSIDEAGEAGGNVQFANRFEYNTIPIPISMTSGKSSAELTLTFGGIGATLDRPIYSAYTTADPYFVPASTDPQGTAPTLTGQKATTTLMAAQAIGTTSSPGILITELQNLYGSSGYYNALLARQAIILNGTPNADGTYNWIAPTGAPPEVGGLDLFTNVSSWTSSNANATADQWRQQIGHTQGGPGYTAFPDELISALTETYITPPIQDANGNTVSGLDHYHDATIMARIVAAMDGTSYEQDSDGGLIQQGSSAAANSAWTGLTSGARTSGTYAGLTSREPTVHGGGDLQGVDTYTLGWSMIQLLNDSTAAPIFKTYLSKSYNADLNGTSMMRATAYERLLFGMINFYAGHTGGTETQNLFQMLSLYSSYVALQKLQALFPNSAYVVSPATYGSGNWLGNATPLQAAEMVMGLYPDTLRGVVNTQITNYGLTAKGFGEAGGALSTGFDGGGYGQIIPWLTPRIAQLAQWDATASPSIVSQFANVANTTIDSFAQFLSPQDNATVNSNGVITSNIYDFAEEPYITYREPKDVNVDAVRLNYNAQFLASDPTVGLNDPLALRAAYQNAINGLFPDTGAGAGNGGNAGGGRGGGSINYLKDLSAYENTLRALMNVNPSTLAPFPAEPGQPDFAWADVQSGAVAFINNGERVYANLDWRNGSTPSDVARIHDTTSSVERDAELFMPYNSATVQPDGNLTSSNLLGAKVVRYGNYLMVLNDGSSTYVASLPPGTGMVEDLISKNMYSPGTNVSVAVGQAAIFWLAAGNTIPALASGADVGAVGIPGSNSFTNSVYTITGAGADIGGSIDAFRFVSTAASSNATISAEVLSQTSGNNLAQAGIMVRDGSAPNAAFAAVLRTPGGGIRFYYRTSAGAAAVWVAVSDPLSQVWVKLTRSGNNMSAYCSTDGISWTQIGATQSILLPSLAQVGLAVSSNSTTATSTATFGNVVLSPAVAPTVVAVANASATAITGKTVNLSVLGADVGGEANLTYTWSMIGTSADQVTFSANGTNAAKNTIATFSAAGTYTLGVFIRNSGGASAISTITVTVVPTLTDLSISPTTVLLGNGQTQSFAASAIDQFGMPMQSASQITYSVISGLGSVDPSGLYTAPASSSGTATVRATFGSLIANATVTIFAPVIGIFSGNANIGTQNSSQSSNYNSSTSTYTVAGSGDVSNTSDTLQYLYIPFSGNGTITAEVTSQTNTNQWAKGGLMFRDSLAANAMNAFVAVTPGKGLTFQYRNSTGGSESFTSTGTTVAPYWVRLTRSGNSITGSASADGVTWTQVGSTQTINMGTTAYVGLFSVSVTTAISTATFTNVALTAPATTPHTIFPNSHDIGGPTIAGSYAESGSVVTLTGSGGDIWNTSDQFQFAYSTLTGSNITLTARVASIPSGSSAVNAKAGVMIRDSLDANSPYVDLVISPSGKIRYDSRTTFGGSSTESTPNPNSFTMPYWLRVTRTLASGSNYVFKVFSSPDGLSWVQVGSSQIISMGPTAFVGIALTAVTNSVLATATYDNISITGNGTPDVAPTIATSASGPSSINGTSANLSVLGADSDGGESNLTYTWNAIGVLPGNVTFSANGTNAAKNSTVTFTALGTYNFRATITDSGGLSVTGGIVQVIVNQTLTGIAIAPGASSISPGASQQFSAIAMDQFGLPMVSQPSFLWSVSSGVGGIDSSGYYSAPLTGTSATIQAATGGKTGSATLSIVNQSPIISTSVGAATSDSAVIGTTVALSVSAGDDSGAGNLIYAWLAINNPPGTVVFADSGTNSASNTTAKFMQPGNYTLQVVVTDPSGAATTSIVNFGYVPGDANHDGVVNLLDFNTLAADFNQSSQTYSEGDFNYDGVVNLLDLNAIATNFGMTAAPSSPIASPLPLGSSGLDLFSTKPIPRSDAMTDLFP